MTITDSTRRGFVADSSRLALATLLSLQLPWLSSLAGCAAQDARASDRSSTLTAEEFRALEAFAALIIPSEDGTPGAREAGAARFIDRALGTPFFAPSLPLIRKGLADLDRRARDGGVAREFAGLTARQQRAIILLIESGDFFKTARTLVIIGTFAEPKHGGNRDHIGWTMIGMEHQPAYTAPFGYYDAAARAS